MLATADWNERKFNAYTKLSHMSYKDKVIWQIRSLLTDAWYGLSLIDGLTYSLPSIKLLKYKFHSLISQIKRSIRRIYYRIRFSGD